MNYPGKNLDSLEPKTDLAVTHLLSFMAHLFVSRETIIEQENYGQQRPAKKHRRSDEGPLVTLTSESKRRALASITNQPPSRDSRTVVEKQCSRAMVKRQGIQEPHSTVSYDGVECFLLLLVVLDLALCIHVPTLILYAHT